jgi:hypothetical protein
MASGSVPIPDPTLLTTQAQEKGMLAVREVLETRLHGDEKAAEIKWQMLKAHEGQLVSIVQLQARHEEQLKAVNREMALQFAASKEAVSAALQAAKESVAQQENCNREATRKAEESFTKQIDALYALFRAGEKSTDDKIAANKDSLRMMEGQKKGSGDMLGYILAAVLALVAVAEYLRH